MTVVAWDGKTLAADKRATNCGMIYSVQKIMRIDRDTLAGISGHLGHGLAVCAWLKAGRDVATFPKAEKDDQAFVMVIHRDGRIERFEGIALPILVEARTHVIGSGRDFALAALHLGCDAVEAVGVASALSSECGNGINTLQFEQAP